jgi:serine/threonine-protein kinase
VTPAAAVLTPGDRFEGYVIERVLGHGGHASVYRAHRDAEPIDSDRAVALKVLDRRRCGPADLARLQREFTLARRLDHPHIVRMDWLGHDWLTMEFVDGGSVGIRHDLTERLSALAQTADALDYTHRHGILHCDVKPANILVANSQAKRGAVLIDFGVAHVVAQGVGELPPAHIETSLPYAAPELLYGKAFSAASDEYALACTTVELLTGSPPFTASTTMALVDQHLKRSPPRISRNRDWVPHAVDSILAKAMAKTPGKRYDSCVQFISLISRALS